MINDFTIMIIMKWKILDCPPFVFKLFQVVMVQTRIELLSGPAQGGGGANRAIARGPTFWGAHKLFSYILLILIKQ